MHIVDEYTKAYFAGFIDGEGCIRIERAPYRNHPNQSPRYTMRIAITHTCLDILEAIRDCYNGSIRPHNTAGRNFPCYNLVIQAQNALYCLQDLLPYLKLKRQQAQLAIEFQKSLRPVGYNPHLTDKEIDYREGVYKRMSELKKVTTNLF